jgi:uroporphyrinogen-III synthase
MRVLVTRPEPQASEWTHALSSRGVPALALPLLAILPAEDPSALARAWASLDQLDGVMFVSPAAAQAWIDARPDGPPPGRPAPSGGSERSDRGGTTFNAWPARVWVAAPGPGTARSQAALGAEQTLTPAADAEQFDSDALWSAIGGRDWRGQRILIVHGGTGRDELAQRWRDAGAVVDRLQAYRRGDAVWSTAQAAAFDAALDDPAAHVWLFSSGDAIGRLERRAPQVQWQAHRAVCTHPAIAERARRAGFGSLHDCRPEIDDVAAAVRDCARAAAS